MISHYIQSNILGIISLVLWAPGLLFIQSAERESTLPGGHLMVLSVEGINITGSIGRIIHMSEVIIILVVNFFSCPLRLDFGSNKIPGSQAGMTPGDINFHNGILG